MPRPLQRQSTARESFGWQKAIKLAIIAGYTSVILVMLLGQSRVFYSMSRDGLLPKLFSDIHPKYRTPWRSNLLVHGFREPVRGICADSSGR